MKADRTPKPKAERKHVSVGMEMDLYAEVLAAAQKAERTVGAEIRFALREHIKPYRTVTVRGAVGPDKGELEAGMAVLKAATEKARDTP